MGLKTLPPHKDSFFKNASDTFGYFHDVRELLRVLRGAVQTRSGLLDGFVQAQTARKWHRHIRFVLTHLSASLGVGRGLAPSLKWVANHKGCEVFLSQCLLLMASSVDQGYALEPTLQRLLERCDRMCRLYQRMSVATAQIRLQALVIAVLPALCFALVTFISPEKMGHFLSMWVGKVAVCGVAIMDIVAWKWMQSIIRKTLPQE